MEKSENQSLSHVRLFVTPWTVVNQAPLSRGFPRQGYWSGLPFSSPGDLPDSWITWSPSLQAESLLSEPPGKLQKIYKGKYSSIYLQRQIWKIYIKINCKGKRTVGQANKGINVEKIQYVKKIKIIRKRKNRREKKAKKFKKRKTPQNCKSPTQRQRFIITIKSVTEYTRMYIYP